MRKAMSNAPRVAMGAAAAAGAVAETSVGASSLRAGCAAGVSRSSRSVPAVSFAVTSVPIGNSAMTTMISVATTNVKPTAMGRLR